MEGAGGAQARVRLEEKTPEYEILQEEELSEKPTTTAVVKEEDDEDNEKKAIRNKGKEEKTLFDEEEEDEEMDSTPADVLDACVVKYSVKTTPYLQR